MSIKGTLIATLAAGYFVAAAPVAALAGDEAKDKAAKGEKAGCKGKGGCKGKAGEKKEGEKKEGEKKEGEKAEEKK
jgi:hypothetical protein